jgi:hypothetical protein
MTRAEWIELMVILVVSAASWLMWSYFSSPMPLWQVVIGFSVLLLAQSLLRDLTILFRRRHAVTDESLKEAQCFCLESTLGITGIVAAIALVGVSSSMRIVFQRWEFILAIAGTLVLDFLIKDLVISWNPWAIRCEKDHLNLIVRWKRKSR